MDGPYLWCIVVSFLSPPSIHPKSPKYDHAVLDHLSCVSAAKSDRDALVSEVTAFLSTASEISAEDRAEIADLIGKAAAANKISDIEAAVDDLRETYDRIRGD